MSYKLVTESSIQDGDQEPPTLGNNETDSASPYGFQARIATLWILFAVGSLGNLLVFAWLCLFRRRRSRLYKIVFGISIADMCVCIFNVLVSAILELQGTSWYAGNIVCKLVMFMQSVSLMASSNMVVLLAVDRHQAVRNPLKKGYNLKGVIAMAWACALVFSIPQLIIWYQKETGALKTCSTSFPEPVASWKVAYITYAAVVSFLIPFVVVAIAYIRITKQIWIRASGGSMHHSIKTTTVYSNGNRMNLRVTSSALLIKAKNKTLTMSTVIILVFMACGLPYFIVEIIRLYNSGFAIDQNVYAVLGTFAVSNSAVNPYIFLVFNLGSRGRFTRDRSSTT
ncbi:cardioacceleratory peptide receptor-like [Patiria miniata]|uniref:G-protein coupled receptors family 1 profile domain-containing protein n=1 Tax=Patiria miniata TaxID=46514 RepID=A0A914BE14_PATMI|nr:cardioacceleratory peptide receptor-like [Patiria miniata]